MTMRQRSAYPRRSLFVISALAGILLLVSVDLFARQKTPPVNSSSSPQATTSSPGEDARALLPTIPSSPRLSPPSGYAGSIPGDVAPVADPDGYKNLYGYSGPYYNTTNLDGRVVVLDHALYTWPTSTWKVSGMLRNQARTPVHIAGVTARLLGSKGQLLATASGTVPV